MGAANDLASRVRGGGDPSTDQRQTPHRDRALIEASLDPLVTIGPDGKITDVNEATILATGLPREALIGSDFSDYFTEPAKAREGYLRVFAEGKVRDYPLTLRRKDGSTMDVVYNASVFRDEAGRVVGVFAAARDVTERIAAEIALRATNRRLLMISIVNQVLVRATDERSLFQEACEILKDVGGYRFVWVGRAIVEGKQVRPVAQAGFERGYLESAKITWDDTERGRGPTGRAIRERTPQVAQDFLRDPAMVPWRAQAIKRGYASSAAVPFVVGDDVFLLQVYADRAGAFDGEDVATLTEIASDLSMGVSAIRMRDALLESEERYRILADNARDLVVRSSAEGPWEYASPSVERILGYTPREAIGLRSLDLLHPDDRDRVMNARQEMVETGRSVPLQMRLRRKDGTYTWIESTTTPVKGPDGNVIALISVVRDVNDRKAAEDALRLSEERYRGIIESQNDLIIRVDDKGIFTFANEAYCEMFGLDRRSIVGQKGFQPLVHPDDLPAALEAVKALDQPPYRVSIEQRVMTPKGIRWIAWEDSAIRNEGKTVEIQAVGRDITQRKAAEEEIRRLNASLESRVAERTRDLEAANKELEAFTYSISHDLRAPLRAVDGFSKALLKDETERLSERGREDLQRVGAAARRMGALIDELLKLSRIGRAEPHRTDIDLSARAAEMLRDLQQAYPTRHVDVRIEPGLHAKADPSLLDVVLSNLLDNAWKFTGKRDHAHIEVGKTTTPRGEAYFVRDDGEGFDPEFAGKLFQPFQRLHSEREFPGNGIGLASVKRALTRHGGEAWGEGSPGKGATFYFTIPNGS